MEPQQGRALCRPWWLGVREGGFGGLGAFSGVMVYREITRAENFIPPLLPPLPDKGEITREVRHRSCAMPTVPLAWKLPESFSSRNPPCFLLAHCRCSTLSLPISHVLSRGLCQTRSQVV